MAEEMIMGPEVPPEAPKPRAHSGRRDPEKRRMQNREAQRAYSKYNLAACARLFYLECLCLTMLLLEGHEKSSKWRVLSEAKLPITEKLEQSAISSPTASISQRLHQP